LFALFSSLPGVLGHPGRGNDAPASTFLDALALRRRASGLPATSLAWGPWAGQAGTVNGPMNGTVPMSRELGLALFDAALAFDQPTAADAARFIGDAISRELSGAVRQENLIEHR
jgi:hypothetical protein